MPHARSLCQDVCYGLQDGDLDLETAETVLSAYAAAYIHEMKMCWLKIECVLLGGALDGRLRAGSYPGLVNSVDILYIPYDDLRRLQHTRQELLLDQNVSERPPLILWLGR